MNPCTCWLCTLESLRAYRWVTILSIASEVFWGLVVPGVVCWALWRLA